MYHVLIGVESRLYRGGVGTELIDVYSRRILKGKLRLSLFPFLSSLLNSIPFIPVPFTRSVRLAFV
jgi:hypothetical protein